MQTLVLPLQITEPQPPLTSKPFQTTTIICQSNNNHKPESQINNITEIPKSHLNHQHHCKPPTTTQNTNCKHSTQHQQSLNNIIITTQNQTTSQNHTHTHPQQKKNQKRKRDGRKKEKRSRDESEREKSPPSTFYLQSGHLGEILSFFRVPMNFNVHLQLPNVLITTK
jgi:hypothetical protein